jgi:hypothetical protein
VQIFKIANLLLLLFAAGPYAYGQNRILPARLIDTIPKKIDSLAPVVVTGVLKPRLRGDTIEYNTSSIHLRAYDNVEELLRRLPGLQIDANGNITYNGEKVEHLLVDGEDIFKANPSLITRTFDASKIASVQLLDRKSDEAIFTGIDNGSRTKTLNLVVKENAKNGYFGNVEVGGDLKQYYNVHGALASFRDKEQFTALGFGANTGSLGNSGGEGIGTLTVLDVKSDPLGTSAGRGIPQFSAAAIHYANSWNAPESHFSTNYQFGHLSTHPMSTIQTLQTQHDSVFGQEQANESWNVSTENWLYGTYDFAPNASCKFRMTFNGLSSVAQNQFSSIGVSSFNDTTVNSSHLNIRDNVDQKSIGAGISWHARLGRKSGRSFSAVAYFNKNDNTIDGYLFSINRFFYANGTEQGADTVDQRKQIADHSINIGADLSYVEPAWKNSNLGLGYGIYIMNDDPTQATFKNSDGKYNELVDSLSSRLKTLAINQYLMINLRGKSDNLTYTIGSSFAGFGYQQHDLMKDSTMHLSYVNWTPQILLNYTVSPSTSAFLNYTVSTQRPSLTQLQPVTNNSDPLHITLGNPALRPGLSHSFKLELRRSKAWLINCNFDLSLTNHSISTRTLTDSLGRQISQPVNVDGDQKAGINISASRRLVGIDLSLYTSASYLRTQSYINSNLSNNNNSAWKGGFSLNKYVENKYSFRLSTYFVYFNQSSSINTGVPIGYWTQNHVGAIRVFLIRNFELGTDATYSWQQKSSTFSANTSVIIWNAYAGRNWLKSKLVTKIQLNNILNQNSGVSRTNLNNTNTQTFTNILGHYWMVSVIYHFDKKFKQK